MKKKTYAPEYTTDPSREILSHSGQRRVISPVGRERDDHRNIEWLSILNAQVISYSKSVGSKLRDAMTQCVALNL
jgi:hypothetical protein